MLVAVSHALDGSGLPVVPTEVIVEDRDLPIFQHDARNIRRGRRPQFPHRVDGAAPGKKHRRRYKHCGRCCKNRQANEPTTGDGSYHARENAVLLMLSVSNRSTKLLRIAVAHSVMLIFRAKTSESVAVSRSSVSRICERSASERCRSSGS